MVYRFIMVLILVAAASTDCALVRQMRPHSNYSLDIQYIQSLKQQKTYYVKLDLTLQKDSPLSDIQISFTQNSTNRKQPLNYLFGIQQFNQSGAKHLYNVSDYHQHVVNSSVQTMVINLNKTELNELPIYFFKITVEQNQNVDQDTEVTIDINNKYSIVPFEIRELNHTQKIQLVFSKYYQEEYFINLKYSELKGSYQQMIYLNFEKHLDNKISLVRKQVDKQDKTDISVKQLNFDYRWYIEIEHLKEYQIKLKPSKSQGQQYLVNMDLKLVTHKINDGPNPPPGPDKKPHSVAKIVALVFIIVACVVLVGISVAIVIKLRGKKQQPLLEEGEQSLQNV